MMDLMIMGGHMPVRGIVTAEGYSTGLTGTQVQPPAMYFDAFLTDIFFSGFDLRDCAQVLADMAVLTHPLKLRDSGINSGGPDPQSRAIFLSRTSRIAVERVSSRARRK